MKAFSLVGLMVVVGIICLVMFGGDSSPVSTPGQLEEKLRLLKSAEKRALEMKAASTISSFKMGNMRLPDSLDEVTGLAEAPAGYRWDYDSTNGSIRLVTESE